MIKNRIKKSLHKLKNPQMEFPVDDTETKPKYGVKIFGTKENNPGFISMKIIVDPRCIR